MDKERSVTLAIVLSNDLKKRYIDLLLPLFSIEGKITMPD